jgi:eukaryotic-like serine/threonine-protein kinase
VKEPAASLTKRFYSFGPFRLFVNERELFRGSEPVGLPPRALDALLVLVRRHGHVVDKDELMKALWPDTFVEETSLVKQISLLRKELGERPEGKPYIETIPRRGYRFAAVVTESWEEEAAPAPQLLEQSATTGQRDERPALLPWVLFATTAVALFTLAIVYFRQAPPEVPLRRFALVPQQSLLISSYNTDVALSPDGRHIAYNGNRRLWVHDLDREQPRSFDAAESVAEPFWSPDSRFIGYFTRTELRVIPVQGGSPVTVCGVPGEPWGASWSPDGEVIVLSTGNPPGLYEVAASGGVAKPIASAEEPGITSGGPMRAIYRPHFLPAEAGPRVLLAVYGTRSETIMMVQDLENGRREILGPGALPAYSPSGHIVFQESGFVYRLWAMPFSLDTLKPTGKAFRVVQNGREPTVSTDGSLVYVEADLPGSQLVWRNRQGEKIGEVDRPQPTVRNPDLSPDGMFLVAAGGESINFTDAWIYDLERGARSRLTTAPEELHRVLSPQWSPDGAEIAYTVRGQGLFIRRVDRSEKARNVLPTKGRLVVNDWSNDGEYILYEAYAPETSSDLWYLKRNKKGGGWEPHPFLKTSFVEGTANLSPNGRYVAYHSRESGRAEVYLTTFPTAGRKQLVSARGGHDPRWSRDGNELFYVNGERKLVSVPISASSGLTLGSASPLFEILKGPIEFDNSADGSRFIFSEPVDEARPPVIRFVENWFAEFQDLK